MELLSIRRITRMKTTEETRWGYIDKETCHYQMLCKAIYIFGLRIFWWTYFWEQVPNWAVYQNNCCGSTDWKSKNPPLIDFHSQNKIIYKIEL